MNKYTYIGPKSINGVDISMLSIHASKLQIRHNSIAYLLADSRFFLDFEYQGGVKSTFSGVFDSQQGRDRKLQFWSYPSEILNLKSSNINETLGHTTLVKPLNTYMTCTSKKQMRL